MAKRKPLDVHGKCLKLREGGPQAICRKSKGHDESEDPQRRRHYDPDQDIYWTDDR